MVRFQGEHDRIPAVQQAWFKPPEQGVATTLRCATRPMLDGVLPWAIDAAAAERLWALSEQLTESR
ncbi:MAG: hypothetical protein LBJ65_14030 [Burkholderia sp.]|jgi:hypothetical protein|uniref:hypothetical protein n=1 Tax=Burkholderia sp. TaxID=36773 RepID=UPI0028222E84|nr:hypothetical protein [Burkholderia sp.]MDR0242714.1 hypothetical protein [Burkholderia sp.]